MRKTTLLLALPLAAIMLGSCSAGGSGKKKDSVEKVLLACDASFQNIMDNEIDVFEYTFNTPKRSPQAWVIPYYVSQRAAFDSLLTKGNNIRTIVAGRQLTKEERVRLNNQKLNPREQRIAVDAIALIVNPNNPQDAISLTEVRQVLSGEVRTWGEMWPTKLDSISVVFDQNGSSLMEFMRDSINGGKPFGPNVYAQTSPREVFEKVAKNKGALGIVGVSWISANMDGTELSKDEMRELSSSSDPSNLGFKTDIKVLAVSGDESIHPVKPYQAYIFDGTYPLYRSIYMITTTVGGTYNNAFYSFVTGMQGQKVIQLTGVLPGTVQPRMVQLSRNDD